MQGWLRLKAASEGTGADITGNYTGSTLEVVLIPHGIGPTTAHTPPYLQRAHRGPTCPVAQLHTRARVAEAGENDWLWGTKKIQTWTCTEARCGQPLLALAQPMSQKQTGTAVGGQNAAACTLLQAKSLHRPFMLQYGSLLGQECQSWERGEYRQIGPCPQDPWDLIPPLVGHKCLLGRREALPSHLAVTVASPSSAPPSTKATAAWTPHLWGKM